MNLFKTKEIVSRLLHLRPSNRDNDRALVANIWVATLIKNGYNPKQMSAYQLLDMYVKGSLPNADHITRTRRFLQEHHPELRGETYAKRHGIAEEVRTTIHTAKYTT